MGTAHRHHAPPGGGGERSRRPHRAATAVLGTAVVVGVGWLAAPWVAMARRGTLDQQCVRSVRFLRAECGPPVIPLPRRPVEEVRAL
ncbi:hypothetical protein WCD74_00700 [Actinomycetospora sp. OC33-EN08]|uniref:Uncharacterized protein n=1 Tax=Actinomycetospora aurantiaca TaxID=3129233 RepID=A0ABU8MGC2_9PSEU